MANLSHYSDIPIQRLLISHYYEVHTNYKVHFTGNR